MWAHPCSSPIGRGQPILKGQFVESTQAPAPAPAKLLYRIRLDTANATAEVRIATLGPNMIKYLSCLTLRVDMVASYGRALAWSTELVSMLDVQARKICSEIGSHNSRSESTTVVSKLKSNKPTKVKTKFEAIKFLLEIVKFVPGN